MSRAEWQQELDRIIAAQPCAWARLRPKMIVLPKWMCGGYGAWTYLNLIVVTAAQSRCPAYVRRYILGHEYGHIAGGHVALQWLWLLAGVFYAVGLWAPAVLLLAICLKVVLFYGITSKRMGTERELYADRFAALGDDPVSVLAAARWMTEITGEQKRPQRAQRLEALEQLAQARDR